MPPKSRRKLDSDTEDDGPSGRLEAESSTPKRPATTATNELVYDGLAAVYCEAYRVVSGPKGSVADNGVDSATGWLPLATAPEEYAAHGHMMLLMKPSVSERTYDLLVQLPDGVDLPMCRADDVAVTVVFPAGTVFVAAPGLTLRVVPRTRALDAIRSGFRFPFSVDASRPYRKWRGLELTPPSAEMFRARVAAFQGPKCGLTDKLQCILPSDSRHTLAWVERETATRGDEWAAAREVARAGLAAIGNVSRVDISGRRARAPSAAMRGRAPTHAHARSRSPSPRRSQSHAARGMDDALRNLAAAAQHGDARATEIAMARFPADIVLALRVALGIEAGELHGMRGDTDAPLSQDKARLCAAAVRAVAAHRGAATPHAAVDEHDMWAALESGALWERDGVRRLAAVRDDRAQTAGVERALAAGGESAAVARTLACVGRALLLWPAVRRAFPRHDAARRAAHAAAQVTRETLSLIDGRAALALHAAAQARVPAPGADSDHPADKDADPLRFRGKLVPVAPAAAAATAGPGAPATHTRADAVPPQPKQGIALHAYHLDVLMHPPRVAELNGMVLDAIARRVRRPRDGDADDASPLADVPLYALLGYVQTHVDVRTVAAGMRDTLRAAVRMSHSTDQSAPDAVHAELELLADALLDARRTPPGEHRTHARSRSGAHAHAHAHAADDDSDDSAVVSAKSDSASASDVDDDDDDDGGSSNSDNRDKDGDDGGDSDSGSDRSHNNSNSDGDDRGDAQGSGDDSGRDSGADDDVVVRDAVPARHRTLGERVRDTIGRVEDGARHAVHALERDARVAATHVAGAVKSASRWTEAHVRDAVHTAARRVARATAPRISAGGRGDAMADDDDDVGTPLEPVGAQWTLQEALDGGGAPHSAPPRSVALFEEKLATGTLFREFTHMCELGAGVRVRVMRDGAADVAAVTAARTLCLCTAAGEPMCIAPDPVSAEWARHGGAVLVVDAGGAAGRACACIVSPGTLVACDDAGACVLHALDDATRDAVRHPVWGDGRCVRDAPACAGNADATDAPRACQAAVPVPARARVHATGTLLQGGAAVCVQGRVLRPVQCMYTGSTCDELVCAAPVDVAVCTQRADGRTLSVITLAADATLVVDRGSDVLSVYRAVGHAPVGVLPACRNHATSKLVARACRVALECVALHAFAGAAAAAARATAADCERTRAAAEADAEALAADAATGTVATFAVRSLPMIHALCVAAVSGTPRLAPNATLRVARRVAEEAAAYLAAPPMGASPPVAMQAGGARAVPRAHSAPPAPQRETALSAPEAVEVLHDLQLVFADAVPLSRVGADGAMHVSRRLTKLFGTGAGLALPLGRPPLIAQPLTPVLAALLRTCVARSGGGAQDAPNALLVDVYRSPGDGVALHALDASQVGSLAASREMLFVGDSAADGVRSISFEDTSAATAPVSLQPRSGQWIDMQRADGAGIKAHCVPTADVGDVGWCALIQPVRLCGLRLGARVRTKMGEELVVTAIDTDARTYTAASTRPGAAAVPASVHRMSPGGGTAPEHTQWTV